MSDLSYHGEENEQAEEAKKQGELERMQELKDLREVVTSPAGRRLYWRLMDHCGPMRSPKHHSGSETYLRIGKQEVGFFLLNELLSASPETYLQMIKERNESNG